MKIDVRYAAHPNAVRAFDTDELRQNFLIENLFAPDEISLTYSHYDRMIIGGAMPLEGLSLGAPKQIGQERFLAEVDKALYTNVLTILTGLHGAFADQGYSTEPPEDQALHTPNIPPQYDFSTNLVQMITLKIAYEQGDVQLTVSLLNSARGQIYLLDCDMDEHLDILAHAVDIAEHIQNGGTHPYLMHEYIVRKSARQAGGVSTVDLGYVLV